MHKSIVFSSERLVIDDHVAYLMMHMLSFPIGRDGEKTPEVCATKVLMDTYQASILAG